MNRLSCCLLLAALLPAASCTRSADATSAGAPTGEIKTVVYHVPGMSCPACGAEIEEALTAMPGVTAAKTDVKKTTITVTADAGQFTAEAGLAAIQNLKADYANATIKPEGMSVGN